MIRFYEETKHCHCLRCNKNFTLSFWQWLFGMKSGITGHRYAKCPHCGEYHWHEIIVKE